MIKNKAIILLGILVLVFLISSVAAAEQLTQVQQDYYANAVAGQAGTGNSPLTDSQLTQLMTTKANDPNLGKFVSGLNSEDFQRAVRTPEGLDLLTPENPTVWNKLETEMANKGSWMNKEANRDTQMRFFEGKGLNLGPGFKDGVKIGGGPETPSSSSHVEVLSYDKTTGLAELKGNGGSTKINLNEVKAFCGDGENCVTLNKDASVDYNGAKLGHGQFDFRESSVGGGLQKTRTVDVKYEKGFFNTEKNLDLSGFADKDTVFNINHEGGKGIANLPDGSSVKDTSYSVGYDGDNFKVTSGGKEVSLISTQGNQMAGLNGGSALYIAKTDNSGAAFQFNKDSQVDLYNFHQGGLLDSSPSKYGTVAYKGDWMLADGLRTGAPSSYTTVPLVTFSDVKSGWLDMGQGNARKMTIYNGGSTDFSVTGLARNSQVAVDYSGLEYATGNVLLTTQDGMSVIARNTEAGDGQLAIEFGNKDPRTIGTFRGIIEVESGDSITREVRFNNRLMNVPLGIRPDQVQLGIVQGGKFTPTANNWDVSSVSGSTAAVGSTSTPQTLTQVSSAATQAMALSVDSRMAKNLEVLKESPNMYQAPLANAGPAEMAGFTSILENIKQLAALGAIDKAQKECAKIENYEFKEGKCQPKS